MLNRPFNISLIDLKQTLSLIKGFKTKRVIFDPVSQAAAC